MGQLLAPREELIRFAVRDLRSGTAHREVVDMLCRNGMEPDEAEQATGEARRIAFGERGAEVASGFGAVGCGLAMVAVGVGLSLVSVAAGSGRGVVFTGLIVAGVLAVVRGLTRSASR